MSNCCGFDAKDLCSQFDFQIKETKEGVQVEVKPKDASKADSLKAMAKACKDFCKC